jgi:CBS domain-containing protein
MTSVATLRWDTADPELRVADAMHLGLVSCSMEASLRAVAALMSDNRVHCVVVIDDPSDTRSLWGVISDHDLIAAATVRALDEQTAGATAMKPAVTVAPEATLASAAQQMTKHGVAHLVVVDPIKDRPLGVISTLDLAGALAAARTPASSATDAYFAARVPRGAADCGT